MGKLRFGGENLPKGSTTWYDHINPDGSRGGQVFVKPGQTVDEERVTDADYYVNSGMAERIADDAPAPAPTE